MKIKNRKMTLYRVGVLMGRRTSTSIWVTHAQLAKLNCVAIGKEIFLSNYYCYFGGNIWVIRSRDGLQYIPYRHRPDQGDNNLLNELVQ